MRQPASNPRLDRAALAVHAHLARPNAARSSNRLKERLHFARTQGYKPDELIQLIQQLG
jgi:hypothetical protein